MNNDNGRALADHAPPQNLEAERSVLGGMLLDNSTIPRVLQILSADDFYRSAHQVLAAAIFELWAATGAADPITVIDELVRRGQYVEFGGNEYLLKVRESVPHAANTAYHAEIVRQRSVMRQLIQSSTEVIRDGYSDLYTADQVYEAAARKFAAIPVDRGAWPELTLERAQASPPFPVDVFPPGLARYCRAVANVTLAPVDMAGAAMLATASAAIGQSVNLYLKSTWHESPLLYLLVVAEPGRAKTPTLKLVVRPLINLDGDLRTSSKLARVAWEEDRRQAGRSAPSQPEPPQMRAVVKDVTRETLVAILADNPRGVLANPDEATAWVASFNEYKAKGSDRQFWLDIWSSTPISVDREGGRRSSWVGSPLVTVLGGLPPEMLGALAEEQGRNDGFMDRLLFTYPSAYPQQVWTEEQVDDNDEAAWHAVIQKLHRAPMAFDEERSRWRPHLVDLDVEGKALWVAWFNEHGQESDDVDQPVWVPGAWMKLKGYCARLALILSRLRLAIDPDRSTGDVRSPVTGLDVAGAIQLIEYFKAHLGRVHHWQTGGTGDRDAFLILEWIRRHDVTEFREALVRQSLRRRFPTIKSMDAPLRVLTESGVIRLRRQLRDPGSPGRKPSRLFEVNPAAKGL
jgi:hypothetical protein